MNFVRRQLPFFALLAFTSLSTVIVAASFHHHEGVESHDGCALCDWQTTASYATPVSVPPVFFSPLLFALVLVFEPLVLPFFSVAPSGRSPPLF